MRLWQNRVYLTLGYESYDDNFKAEDGNPTIALRTFRGGLNVFPGPGMPNFSLNYRSYNRNNDIDAVGTTDNREDNTTNELSANLSYDLFLFDLDHTLSVSFITLDKTDDFESTRVVGSLPIGIDNEIQSVSLRTRFRQPLVTTISYANNDNSFLGGLNAFKFKTLDLRAEYRLLQDRLSLYGGYRWFDAEGENEAQTLGVGNTVIDYTRNQISFGGRFGITARSFFVFDGSSIDFSDNGGTIDLATGQLIPNESFKDYSFRFRLETRF
jgi:hypothetical protein